MRIGTREIDERGPGAAGGPYIIAEIGVNHDGSVERALELVDAAAGAGADAVKLQMFRADLLMGASARLASYQRAAGEQDPAAMLRRLELPADGFERVVRRAHERAIHAIVTVFSVELVEEAERLAWDAYKSASPDVVNRPLLDRLAATGRPLIVSTGASTLEEVRRAVGWLDSCAPRMAVLQCVSAYPVRAEDAAIGAMADLARAFAGPVGYSDHTREEDTGAVAARAGAAILEKHLTYDRGARGPDHAASLDPAGMARYVRLARAREARPDDPRVAPCAKRVLECERDVRAASRQSLTAARRLEAGETIERAAVVIRRPGAGMEPWRLGETIGRRATRRIEPGEPIAEGDVR